MIKKQDQKGHMLTAKRKHSNMHQATGGSIVPGISSDSDRTKSETVTTAKYVLNTLMQG